MVLGSKCRDINGLPMPYRIVYFIASIVVPCVSLLLLIIGAVYLGKATSGKIHYTACGFPILLMWHVTPVLDLMNLRFHYSPVV